MLPPIKNDNDIVLLTHQRLVHNIQEQFGLARAQRPGFHGDIQPEDEDQGYKIFEGWGYFCVVRVLHCGVGGGGQ